KKQGVGSIELRAINAGFSAQEVLACTQAVFDNGLTCTIHGHLEAVDNDVFFNNINSVVERFPNGLEQLMLTVHSPKDSEDNEENRKKSVKLLTRFAKFALQKQMPVHFALENNRIHSNVPSIVNCEGVLSIVNEVNLPNVGICWDFGHVYSNLINFANVPELNSPEAFMKKVVHTHIHAYKGKTHFPFMGDTALPLVQYCNSLKQGGYTGIYNLELDIERFYLQYSPREALETSISELKQCLNMLNID
ncbi:MAG: sugar phosphate isomerase/epimerase, partial [Clostridiales bacterium]|nr:sugar phosphate isomerase/epimerase [Clostridiales bacterium]